LQREAGAHHAPQSRSAKEGLAVVEPPGRSNLSTDPAFRRSLFFLGFERQSDRWGMIDRIAGDILFELSPRFEVFAKSIYCGSCCA